MFTDLAATLTVTQTTLVAALSQSSRMLGLSSSRNTSPCRVPTVTIFKYNYSEKYLEFPVILSILHISKLFFHEEQIFSKQFTFSSK